MELESSNRAYARSWIVSSLLRLGKLWTRGSELLAIKGKLKGLARGPSRAEFASSWETLGT